MIRKNTAAYLLSGSESGNRGFGKCFIENARHLKSLIDVGFLHADDGIARRGIFIFCLFFNIPEDAFKILRAFYVK